MAKAVVHGLTRCRSPWEQRLWWQEHGTGTPHLRSLRNQAQALAHRYRQSPSSPARPPKDSTASQKPYRLGSSIQTQEASPEQGAADLNPSVDVETGVKGPGLSYLFPLHSSTHTFAHRRDVPLHSTPSLLQTGQWLFLKHPSTSVDNLHPKCSHPHLFLQKETSTVVCSLSPPFLGKPFTA